ncbi:hypothetical protein FAES_1356 [Fibrella aestuarina BUZ 2]|uniref:Uncharacterized protein n=1 Tax=Fibrella aestuarina BUZ 2 TaxID=1166018 RepID=I0K5G3_9BACT|nr:hypothetical protein [Fibrella aestuarina]CCG99366.1 hypothetical protein FAES_1356 [Fibrella aestuarina BUZ 2]
MKTGDFIYVRYIGNIRHWSRDPFRAPITWVGAKHFNVAINGQTARFERATLRHENQGHSPSYQLFLSMDTYRQEVELVALRNLMNRTDFLALTVEKQRAIKAILES